MRRASQRALIRLFVAVALLVPAWIAKSGHMVFVSHALCATHGELVHADHHDRADQGHAPALVGADDHEDDHDHCTAIAKDVVMTAPAAGIEPELLPLGRVAPPTTSIVVTPARTRLLLAPKTSPPA